MLGVAAVLAIAVAVTIVVDVDSDDGPTRTTAGSSSTPSRATLPGAPCPTADWTTRERLAQLLMVGVDPGDVDSAQRVVGDHGVGGIFIGGTATQLLASGTLDDLPGPSGVPTTVGVDDEGGRVQRVDALAGDLASARTLAATMSTEEITATARTRGDKLRAYGVTLDFAPVLDVSDQPDTEVIGDRSFGADAETVITSARAFATGLRAADIDVVYKHFPGHGHAQGDSHLGASTTPPIEELDADLAPYREVLREDPDAAVMVGHLMVPGLTDGEPASLSPAAIDGLLRAELDFEGVVYTDDLGGMRAISDDVTLPEAVRQAWTAGADVALIAPPPDVGALLDILEPQAGTDALPTELIDQHLGRVLRSKGYACPVRGR